MKTEIKKTKSFDIATFETLGSNGNTLLTGGFSAALDDDLACGFSLNFTKGCGCANTCNTIAGCACTIPPIA